MVQRKKKMKTTEGNQKIFAALAGIMAEIKALGKDAANKEQRYMFRSFDSVANMLHPLFAKYKVVVMPQVIEQNSSKFTTPKGTIGTHMELKVRYTLYAEDGSYIQPVTCGEATDYSDKATNKCMTAAFKYMLNQVFLIPFADAVDQDYDSPVRTVDDSPAVNTGTAAALSVTPKTVEETQSLAAAKAEQGIDALNEVEKLMRIARIKVNAVTTRLDLNKVIESYPSLKDYVPFHTIVNNKWASLPPVNADAAAKATKRNNKK
jgi:hypothetical protein